MKECQAYAHVNASPQPQQEGQDMKLLYMKLSD